MDRIEGHMGAPLAKMAIRHSRRAAASTFGRCRGRRPGELHLLARRSVVIALLVAAPSTAAASERVDELTAIDYPALG